MKQNKLLHFARGLTAALVVTGLVAGAFPTPIDQTVGLSTYAAAAVDTDLTITKYEIKKNGKAVNNISSKDIVDITLYLRDPKTNTQDVSDINVNTRVSSFSVGTVSTPQVTSSETSPLEFNVTFSNAKYSGKGKDFCFQVSYNNAYENLDLTIRECTEISEEPEPEPEEPDDPLDEPVVQIGRDSIPANLSAGQVFTVNVWVKNLGDADIESGALTVSPSSGLTVADASPSYSLGRLRDGKTASFPVRLRVLDSVDNENQSIDVSLRFRYDDGVSSTLKSGTAEQTLLLSVTLPPENDTAPLVQIGRRSQPKAIAKGETQVVSLWIRNLSDVDLASTLATVSPSSGLMIADNSATYLLGAIPAGGTVTFDVRVKAPGDIDSAAQSLAVSLKYNYMKGRATTQGTTEENIPLSAIATPVSDGTQLAASTPNIIISNYSFGGAQVTAGTTFDLTLEFQNTSASKRVENIVMTLDTGTALAITSSSNSFHFASLSAGGKLSQTVNLQALPDAPSAPAAIAVKFSYEYVDNSTRQNVTVDQTISLPVYQLDRFELTQDSPSVEAWQYEEAYLTLSYVNKGKSTVYNVAAELVGDVGATSRIQNVGNIEAGKSGTIDFIITPEMVGENECTLIVTYEDDAMQLLQKEFTFQVFVNEMSMPEDPGMEDPGMMEPEETGPNWGLIVGVILAVGVIAGIFVLLRRRKKKKAAEVDSFTFDDSLMIDEPADAPAPSDEPTQPIHTESDGEGAHESE